MNGNVVIEYVADCFGAFQLSTDLTGFFLRKERYGKEANSLVAWPVLFTNV